ncbi:MAG: hypothetical protein WAL50_09730 [Kineosporiaceae bacterium]
MRRDSVEQRVRENRARRAARRQDIALSKNPRRDPRAADFGTWSVDDPRRGVHRERLTLAEVEHYLGTGELPGE